MPATVEFWFQADLRIKLMGNSNENQISAQHKMGSCHGNCLRAAGHRMPHLLPEMADAQDHGHWPLAASTAADKDLERGEK
ncbi:MAG: hypothetical protein DMG21_01805 [Acidobacteria bacterium]|nr:MAG: hypothetical protein DMG21_01805 [Acidobacteriota bacterium]